MADKPAVVHIGENSPEGVAYKLFIDIRNAESNSTQTRDRAYILDTYAECLVAATGFRPAKK